MLLLPGSSSRLAVTATLDAVLKQHIAHGRQQRPVIVDTFAVGLASNATARDNISVALYGLAGGWLTRRHGWTIQSRDFPSGQQFVRLNFRAYYSKLHPPAGACLMPPQ